MTFLITSDSIPSRIDVAQLDWVEQDEMELRRTGAKFSVFSTRDFHKTQQMGQLGLFQGYAFEPSGKLYHADPQLWSRDDAPKLHADPANLVGVFCLAEFDFDRSTFLISQDRSSNYPVFHFSRGRDWAVSDDLNVLHGVARQIGVDCPPNPVFAALHTLWGTGFAPETLYTNIRIVPSRHQLRFGADGEIAVVEAHSRRSMLSRYATYGEAMDDVKTRLTARCAGILDGTRSDWQRTVDVSGGHDSRMTLAGFLSTGAAQEMGYFSFGDFSDGADRMVSDYLLAKFNLPLGRVIKRNSNRIFTRAASMAAWSHRLFGMKSKSYMDIGELRIDKYCRVSGFLGEYSRSTGAPIIKGDLPVRSPISTVDNVFEKVEPALSFVSYDGLAEVKKRFVEYYSELLGDVDLTSVNSFVYLEQKGPFHFGMHSAMANKFRVSLDPLGDPAMIAAVSMLDHRDQVKNRVGFEIMRDLGGDDLVFAPFAKKKWPPRWMKETLAGGEAPPVAVRADTVPDWDEVVGDRIVTLPITGDPVHSEIEAEVRALAHYQDLTDTDRVLMVLADMVPRNDPFWDVFDRSLFAPELLAEQHEPLYRGNRYKNNKSNLSVMLFRYHGMEYAPRQSGVFSF